MHVSYKDLICIQVNIWHINKISNWNLPFEKILCLVITELITKTKLSPN